MNVQPSFEETTEIPQKQEQPAFEDTVEVKNQQQPTFEETEPTKKDKYSTSMQKIGTSAEGLAQGFAGPIATLAEQGLNKIGVPGLSDEEIKGRREENPEIFAASEATGLIGGLLTGVGEAGLIAKSVQGLNVAKDAGILAKIGSAALKGAIEMGLIQGGDEISKSMLGQGDPEHPVAVALANTGAMALLGSITGGAFNAAGQGSSKTLKMIENSKLGTKLINFLSGFGHAAAYSAEKGIPSEEMALKQMASIPEDVGAGAQSHMPSFRSGHKLFEESIPKISQRATEAVGGKVAGPAGVWAADKIGIGKALDKMLNKTITRASQKYVAPMILKAASNGAVQNVGQILDYATAIQTGNQAVIKGVDSLFKYGTGEALNYEIPEIDRKVLKKYIEDGGADKQISDEAQQQGAIAPAYAGGGKVNEMGDQQNEISNHWPEQNVLLSSAKGRVSGYLNSIRPQSNKPKLPFDSEHKNKHEDREYNKAIDLALKPISVLKHVKEGTLLPKHVTALTQMYPEVYKHLSQKITERMMQAQVNKEKRPPYKTRQALSLFLGTSLDSTLTPMGIQAAQNVFAQQKAQKAAPSQGSMSGLKTTGADAMTPEQARTKNLNKS